MTLHLVGTTIDGSARERASVPVIINRNPNSSMPTDLHRLRLPENEPDFGGNKTFDTFEYSPAVKAGGLLFIAGQVGVRPDGTVPESFEEQIELAFRRLGAILAYERLGFEDLVELVSYHVRVDEQLDTFRHIKSRYITGAFPTWTILGVAALARPSLLVEIKAVAAVRGSA